MKIVSTNNCWGEPFSRIFTERETKYKAPVAGGTFFCYTSTRSFLPRHVLAFAFALSLSKSLSLRKLKLKLKLKQLNITSKSKTIRLDDVIKYRLQSTIL